MINTQVGVPNRSGPATSAYQNLNRRLNAVVCIAFLDLENKPRLPC